MAEATTGFASRHIGPRAADLPHMLDVVGAPSLDVLMDEAIPAGIRLPAPLDLPDAESEAAFLTRMRGLAARNEPWRSFIGLGYHGCVTPPVILRNLLENPGWYTPYTPYQAEGRAGPAGGAAQLPDRRRRPDGDGDRQRVAARRGHRGRQRR